MKFYDYLINIKIPNKKQKIKELWDVEGIIKNRSNKTFKFDLRPLEKFKNLSVKKSNFKTKADKLVFESKENWVIIDVKELIKYLKSNKTNIVDLEDLISKLDWNIILPKN